MARRRSTFRIGFSLALVCFVAWLVPSVAAAQTSRSYEYESKRVWQTAVRYLRIYEKLKITERDEDAGYVMFEFEDEGRTYQGSMEFVQIKERDGRVVTRAICNIVDRPSYTEIGILDRLGRKLRNDLGPPRRTPGKKAKSDEDQDDDDAPAKDADKEKSKSD